MKRTLLTLCVVLAATAAAEAQIVIQYTKDWGNSKLTVTYVGGYGGYYGGGYGFSGGGGFAPGFLYNSGNTQFAFGTNFLGQGYPWPGYPAPGMTYFGPDSSGYSMNGAGYGAYGGGYGYSGVYPTAYGYRPFGRYPSNLPAGSRGSRPVGAPEEVGALTQQKDVQKGIEKFKAGDYAGALAEFKVAIGRDFSNGLPQLWMALALAGTGDVKNAEKAVASGFASNVTAEQLNAMDVKGAFRAAKEQARYVSAVERAGGRLAGLVFERLGEGAKAKSALEAVLKGAPGDAAATRILARLK